MDKLISVSFGVHVFFVLIALIVTVLRFFVVQDNNDYIKMTKRYEFLLPCYHLSITIIIFTGLILSAVSKFHINYTVYLMIIISLITLAGEFKVHKLFKKTSIKDLNSQDIFRKLAIKKYLLDIIMILVTALIALIL